MQPELIADYACQTGEGCLWHPDERKLYWLDIPPGRLFCYDPDAGRHGKVLDTDGDPIGGFTIQEDGALLLFMGRGSVRLWKDGELTTVIDDIPGEEGSRFNDVMADTRGRVFCGTMPTPNGKLGTLYRLDVDGSVTPLLHDIGVSNGMGFTPDRSQLYYTDSAAHNIYLFDYDAETGDLTNQRVFVTVPEEDGIPDGMTVDAEGCVWSAHWDGSRMTRYRPDGVVDRVVSFPTKKVSCVTFGGNDYTDVYVTTAGGDNKEENGQHAGALFRLRLGVRGVPECRSRIGA